MINLKEGEVETFKEGIAKFMAQAAEGTRVELLISAFSKRLEMGKSRYFRTGIN